MTPSLAPRWSTESERRDRRADRVTDEDAHLAGDGFVLVEDDGLAALVLDLALPRDLVAGLPKTLAITSQEVREALLEPISTIVESVRVTLERCPPELSADLVDRGLVLAPVSAVTGRTREQMPQKGEGPGAAPAVVELLQQLGVA